MFSLYPRQRTNGRDSRIAGQFLPVARVNAAEAKVYWYLDTLRRKERENMNRLAVLIANTRLLRGRLDYVLRASVFLIYYLWR